MPTVQYNTKIASNSLWHANHLIQYQNCSQVPSVCQLSFLYTHYPICYDFGTISNGCCMERSWQQFWYCIGQLSYWRGGRHAEGILLQFWYCIEWVVYGMDLPLGTERLVRTWSLPVVVPRRRLVRVDELPLWLTNSIPGWGAGWCLAFTLDTTHTRRHDALNHLHTVWDAATNALQRVTVQSISGYTWSHQHNVSHCKDFSSLEQGEVWGEAIVVS